MTRSVFSERYRHLCHILVETRKAKGLTQTQVANRLARPQSFVSKYEKAERRLDVIEFLEVVSALGVEAQHLLAKLQGTTRSRKRRK